MRTSAGTFGFVASSSKGSPGASARIVNRTALIPRRAGIEISVRRSRYFDIRGSRGGPSRLGEPAGAAGGVLCLLRPVRERPEVAVPSALGHVAHRLGDRGHARAEHHGNNRDVLDQRSEEHTSELQSPCNLVCRLLLEKKKKT